MHVEETQTKLGPAFIQLYKEKNVLSHFPNPETEAHTHTAGVRDKFKLSSSDSSPGSYWL